MDDDYDEKIRRRAYELWELEGRSGNPEDHWLRAEQELRGGSTEIGGTPAHEASPERSAEAEKMVEQVEVAMDARNARSRPGGRSSGDKNGTGRERA